MYSYSTELAHHGIKGMKWGIRRFQNKDGSLTKAGRKRYGSDSNSGKKADPKASTANASTSGKKSVSEMSDDELRSAITRLQLEQQYRTLKPEKVSAGKKFLNDAVMPAVSEASKNLLKDYMTKVGKQMLGLNESNSKAGEEMINDLRKEVDKIKLKNEYKELTDPNSSTNLAKLATRLKNQDTIKKYTEGTNNDSKPKSKKDEDEDDDD